MPLIPKRSESLGINTVCYFTKFAIPPLSSLPRGRESNPSPCVPRHISPVWPGGLLLEQANDMCQRNLPNNQGREKSKCDKFFHYKTTSWSSSVSEFNGIASWNLAWFLEKNTDTTGANVAGPARCDLAKILAEKKKKKFERRLH